MANLTSVGVTSGVPSSGTGTVSTIDQLLAVGAPISNGSSSLQVGIVGGSSAPQASQPALVVADSPNSSARTITPSSAMTVTLSSNPTLAGGAVTITSGTVTISSNPTVIPSSNVTVALSSAVTNTVTLSSNPTLAGGAVTITSGTVTLSSNPTITSVSSGTIAIANGANTVGVVTAQVSSASPALAVAISSFSNFSVTTTGSSQVSIVQGANTAAVVTAQVSSASPALVVALSSFSNFSVNATVSSAIFTPSSAISTNERGLYTTAQLTQGSVSVSNSSNNTVVTYSSATGGTLRIYGLYLVPLSPVTMTFFNGATQLSGAMFLSNLNLPVQTEPWFSCSSNFVLNLSSSVQTSGMVYYTQS